MVNEQNLRKLYERVIDSGELATKELNDMGFNPRDLTVLIEQGDLKRIKRGQYSFLMVDDLFLYGKEMLSKKQFERATKCFERCYELDSGHFDTCFHLFLICINKRDYESAFKYFETLSSIEDRFQRKDNNFYLYLLSIITEVPEKYREYARNLGFFDISICKDDTRYNDTAAYNRIRTSVMNRKFSWAHKQLLSLTTDFTLDAKDSVVEVLLKQAIILKKESNNKIMSLVKLKKYQEIVSFLEEKKKRHVLSLFDSYILLLAKDILNIGKTRQIPRKRIFETDNLYEAINGYNYQLALKLNREYSEKYNQDVNENIINILLSDLCELISNISSSKSSQRLKPDEKNDDVKFFSHQESVSSDVCLSNTCVGSCELTFSNVIRYLVNQDLESAFRTLKDYMNSINKGEFEFLIVNLIKISLLEGDVQFIKPTVAFVSIVSDNFTFDLVNYINEFYASLSQNKFEKARIYLDIISKAEKIGYSCDLTENLFQILLSTEKMLNYRRENSNLDIIEKAIEDSGRVRTKQLNTNGINGSFDDDFAQAKSTVETGASVLKIDSVQQVEIKAKPSTYGLRNTDEQFVEDKYRQLLAHKGIVLLNPMSDDKMERIQEIVKKYPDMSAFTIGVAEKTQIVLKYCDVTGAKIDAKQLLSIADKAYNNGNYEACIDANLQILHAENASSALVYARIGLSYFKKRNRALAVDYLTVATELTKIAKTPNLYFDFSDFIADIRGIIPKDDRKPRPKVKISDFSSDMDNNYGIENIEEITEFISSSGLDVESACQQLVMTGEQIDTIRLIYAREYYFQGDYEKGDQFVKVVERSQSKTEFTLKLLNEIRRNKKFYSNRTSVKPLKLSLKLQPKKIGKSTNE